jgi:hypothetical protein
MPVRIPALVRKPVIHHDFTADERLQWEGCQHVEAKAATELSSGRFKNSFFAYKRAILTIRLSAGKLFKTFPSVLSPKVRNPARAIAMQAIMDMKVE